MAVAVQTHKGYSGLQTFNYALKPLLMIHIVSNFILSIFNKLKNNRKQIVNNL